MSRGFRQPWRSTVPSELLATLGNLVRDPQLKTEVPFVTRLREGTYYREGIAQLAAEQGRPPQQLEAEAAACLREMSSVRMPTVIDWWQRFSAWMLRDFELVIDEESLSSLRWLDHQHSLLVHFSHRSYLDEWILPMALETAGLQAPTVFAGDNLNFFPLGGLARRTGITHIRRSTSGEPVYRFALRQYIRELLRTGENLTWSIEGGRTRTGKMRPPRYGLLRYVIDGLKSIPDREAYVLPVSVVYDQLPEDEIAAMNHEAQGGAKPGEGRRWLVSYLHGAHNLANRVGRIYVDVGEPMPVLEQLAQFRREDPASRHTVERIGVEICHRINNVVPVTPTAAVCITMLAERRAMTLSEVVDAIRPLAGYLRARNWPIAGGGDLTDRSMIRLTLQHLRRSGVLEAYTGDVTVWRIAEDQHLTAANYRNSAIHVLANRAIVEVTVCGAVIGRDHGGADASTGGRGTGNEMGAGAGAGVGAGPVAGAGVGAGTWDVWRDALRLRDLLMFEFFFPRRPELARQLLDEVRIADRQSRGGDFPMLTAVQARHILDTLASYVCHLVLRPFLDAYAVVAHQLADLPAGVALDEDQFLRHCVVVGRQWALQHRIGSMESASLQLCRNALLVARHRGLIEGRAHDTKAEREAFRDEIDEYRRRIEYLETTSNARNPAPGGSAGPGPALGPAGPGLGSALGPALGSPGGPALGSDLDP